MTLHDLLSDEALRRREFPVTGEQVFLAHAAVSPLPARVAAAIQAHAGASTRTDQESASAGALLAETRRSAARLLGVDPAEVALLGPTSLGLSLVANGLPWQPGDNVVVPRDDYPSNVYPWLALRDRGVEVRWLEGRELGRIEPADVLARVDERTRLVTLASAHFIAGWRPDLEAIGRALRERKVLFCVDGIQTLGACPTPLTHVDFLAADAHKWLLGPNAAGLLFVRREVQDRLRPAVLGWHNVCCPDFIARETLELRTDARRYEAGTPNLLGIAGLRAALSLLEELGADAIQARLLAQRRRLVAGLRDAGMDVLLPEASDRHAGGITSFQEPGGDVARMHQRLAAAGIATSLRTDRHGRRFIRLSPHAYNTDAELDRALQVIRGEA